MHYIRGFWIWGWVGWVLCGGGVWGGGELLGLAEDQPSPLVSRHFLYLGQTLTTPLPFVPLEIIFHPSAGVKPHWHSETQSLRLVSKKEGTTSLQLLSPERTWLAIHATVLPDSQQPVATLLEQLSCRGAVLTISWPDKKSKAAAVISGTIFLIQDWLEFQKQSRSFGSEIQNQVQLAPPLMNLLVEKVTQDIQKRFGYPIQLQEVGGTVTAMGSVPSEAEKTQLLAFLKDFFPHLGTDQLHVNLSSTDQVNLDLQFIEVDQDSALTFGINHNQGQFQWTYPTTPLTFSSHLSFLLSQGKAKVLSNPNLVARHHQSAQLHIGGQIPYEVKTYSRLTVQWKSYGIELNITPHPLPEQQYHLVFALTVSFPLSSGQNQQALPTFTRRAITSEVIIEQDHTAVLSGMVQQLQDLNQSGLPLLGNLPLLGHFFKQSSHKDKATELIMTITPRAYHTTNRRALSTQQPKLENHPIAITP